MKEGERNEHDCASPIGADARRIRIRRLSTIERVSWRRAGFVAEYDLLAEGWTVEAVDSLGSPGMVAGATRLYSIDLVAAHASERVVLRLLGEVDD